MIHKTPSDRLFPIQEHDYSTGVCADGRQVVMGLLCPNLVAYFFNRDGTLLGRENRLWNVPARRMDGNGPYLIYDPEFVEALNLQLGEWQSQLGFRPSTIWIKPFFDDEHPVGIELLPEHYRDLDHADWIDHEEDREGLKRLRDQWIEWGNFVWWWAKDYFMSREGKVEST
jgi:hypothetical protein